MLASKRNISLFLISTSILVMMIFYFNAGTSCTYKIKGNLKVQTQLGHEISPSMEHEVFPLDDVKIRVKAKACRTCRWYNWGEVATDENGFFQIEKNKSGNSCSYGRYIKVDAKFKSNKMEIAKGGLIDEFGMGAKWFRVGEQTRSECTGNSPCNFGNLIFRHSGDHDLSHERARKHADIWHYNTWALDHMIDLGLPINKDAGDKLRVVYPFDRLIFGKSESSYVSPGTKIIHLFGNRNRDHFVLETLWHELAHVWAFRYTTGETVMRNYIISHLNTHGVVTKPQVAFHEGFAEWFMFNLKNRMRQERGDTTFSPRIFTKDYLAQQWNIKDHGHSKCEHTIPPFSRSNDEGRLECLDLGWENILSQLNFDDQSYPGNEEETKNLFLMDLFDSDLCEDYSEYACTAEYKISRMYRDKINCPDFPVRLTFKEILDIVNGLDDSDMNLNTFLNKVKNTLQITNSDKNIFKTVIDPTTTEDFDAYYCKNGLFLEDLNLGAQGLEYNWRDEGVHFRKNTPIFMQIRNRGFENTPPLSFVHNPIQYFGPATMQEFNSAVVQLPAYGQYNTIFPMSGAGYSMDIILPKAVNGSLERTTLSWHTEVNQASKSGGSFSTSEHPDWETNEYHFTFGSDYNTESIILPIAEKDDLLDENKNAIGFTQANYKSGGSVDYEQDIPTYFVTKSENSDYPHVYNNTAPYDYGINFTQFIGACGVENIGNTPPFFSSVMNIKIGRRTVDQTFIPNLRVHHGYIYPFRVYVDTRLRGAGESIQLKCEVDPPFTESISGNVSELREYNNTSSADFFHTYHFDIVRDNDIARFYELSNLRKPLFGGLSINNPLHDMRAIKNMKEQIDNKAQAFELKFKKLSRYPKMNRSIRNIYRNYQNNKKTIGTQQNKLTERQNRQIRKIIPH